MTPEQAAEYLQVNRETVYRYIRQGKLVASKLGRAYRIPKRSLDLLLFSTRTRPDITLREYTGEDIAEFECSDQTRIPNLESRIGNCESPIVNWGTNGSTNGHEEVGCERWNV